MTAAGIPALLEPIQERLDAATPGPWETYDANEGEWPPRPMWCVANDAFHNPPADEDEPWLAVEIHTGCKEDADFIAASPTDTARLLAAVKAVVALHPREVIAVHEGYGEEAVCPECRLHYPCRTVSAVEAALRGEA